MFLKIFLTFSGAKASSWFLLWSTKGKAEDAVKAMEFSRVSIYRPGFLIAEREQPKMLDGVGKSLAKMFDR